jgi:hypothetical protein
MPEVIINGQFYIPQPPIAQDANACEKALNHLMKHSSDFGANAITVKDYLHELLKTLWAKGERFSGKSPFGNSGWNLDLVYDLVDCGYIPGTIDLDSDGWVSDCNYDEAEAQKLVLELISFVFYGQASTTVPDEEE